jgi:diadenosine tetraphosphate (Ap4A) HIT family hydrolase
MLMIGEDHHRAGGLDPGAPGCKADGVFDLHPAFHATSRPLGALDLCEARLQDDARFPWIVLIPRLPGANALEDVPPDRQAGLFQEILAAGRAVSAMGDFLGRPTARLNVGVLGNITPQLHVHVVGRRPDDEAWPGPVWGAGVSVAWREEMAAALARVARQSLARAGSGL